MVLNLINFAKKKAGKFPGDKYFIKKIYEVFGVNYFEDDLRDILEYIIKELYYSNRELILKLRLKHIDRAIFKYRQAKEKRRIWNTKQYFKASILRAVQETGLDELEPLDDLEIID
ncbi:MAG: hypothetical protein HPY74_16575 [Firmicutes bacterium]|nr:hypothetical protein [Bacillota bacterium]